MNDSRSEIVGQRTRLTILALLTEVRRAEFSYLRDTLDLTAGNLSRHLSVLADAGLVELTKDESGRRPRTWARMTPAGRAALDREVLALERIVRQVRTAGPQRATSPAPEPA